MFVVVLFSAVSLPIFEWSRLKRYYLHCIVTLALSKWKEEGEREPAQFFCVIYQSEPVISVIHVSSF